MSKVMVLKKYQFAMQDGAFSNGVMPFSNGILSFKMLQVVGLEVVSLKPYQTPSMLFNMINTASADH